MKFHQIKEKRLIEVYYYQKIKREIQNGLKEKDNTKK